MKKTRAILTIIIGSLMFTSLLYFLVEVVLRRNIGPDWEAIENTTVGEVSKISYGRGAGAWFTYKYKGKIYEEFDGYEISGLIIGEKYLIKHCPECSGALFSKIKSIKHMPVFTDDERHFETLGTVTSIYEVNSGGTDAGTNIEFTYTIGNQIYRRSQRLEHNYNDKYIGLKIGEKYIVKVWDENYKRAILNLNKNVH
jgi:hypothetical protein